MKREALVPIDDELLDLIRGQQQRVLDRYPARDPVLFPRPAKNPDGKARQQRQPTGRRSTAGWNAATSATSTASPCT